MTAPGHPDVTRSLAAEVDAGNLRLEPDAAEKCAAACDALLESLRTVARESDGLVWTHGYGDFESGRQLAARYSRLATGGPDSFDSVLDGHIEVIMRIRDLFAAAGRAYRETEAANTTRLTR